MTRPHDPDPPIITTGALPSRCCACGQVGLGQSKPYHSGDALVIRVTCGCGWTQRYQVVEAS